MSRTELMDGRIVRSAVLVLVVAATVSGAAYPDSAMVRMQDGTLLATDVYLPESAVSPFPTVLMRTPYNRSARWAGRLGQSYNRNGYAFLVQDTRGKYDSMGQDSVFLTDGVGPNQDGYDTIEWITRQPWSNGKVGMVGESAPGITSYLAAATGHPALVCAQAGYAVASLYDDLTFPGGAYRQGMVESWTERHTEADNPARRPIMPLYNRLWERVDLVRHAEHVRAALYHWGGWYDVANRGTVRAFQALQERGSDAIRGRQILVMGPWTHGNTGRTQGELVYPANCDSINPLKETLPWFDLHLKGAENPLKDVPTVRYYLMGDASDPSAPGNLWRTCSTWPPPEASDSLFYLRDRGLLSPEPRMTEAPPDSYRYDPRDPAPTKGGHNIPGEGPMGPYDQRQVEARGDVLVYSTPVLADPVAVAGDVRAVLFASSSAEDTDFMVKLTDVYPDGRSMLVLEGAVRACLRNSLRREEFLTPGEVYRFEIDLWNTAIVFNRGHRIRVSVTSSNAPRFHVHPNTRTPYDPTAAGLVATNTIYHDREHPSAIILPVIALDR